MKLVNVSLAKIVLGAVTLLALSTMYAQSASASRYAVAYLDGVATCTGNPGSECDET